MTTYLIPKIIALASKLDLLGQSKYADALDGIVVKLAAGEKFDDLLNLFDERVELQDEEDPYDKPVEVQEEDVEYPEDNEPMTREIARDRDKMKQWPEASKMTDEHPDDRRSARLDELKRRVEIHKLRKMLEQATGVDSDTDEEVEPESIDDVVEPVGDVLAESFEDEPENDADDTHVRCNCESSKCEEMDVHTAGGCKAKVNTMAPNGYFYVYRLGPVCDECEDTYRAYNPEYVVRTHDNDSAKKKLRERHENGSWPTKGWLFDGSLENDADDDGILDSLKDKLKEMPELAEKLLTWAKENPTLLKALMLAVPELRILSVLA